jgi:hypothetical protein
LASPARLVMALRSTQEWEHDNRCLLVANALARIQEGSETDGRSWA